MPGPAPSMDPTPTERRMKKLLAACERSGLSVAEFARQRRLPANRLRWWKHEIARRLRLRESRVDSDESVSLIRLPLPALSLSPGVQSRESPPDLITVEFPGGLRVHIPRGSSPEELRGILEAVRSTC